MAVQFDKSGFVVDTASITSPKTISALINVGSGANGTSNMALIFAVSFVNVAAGVATGVSVTWNGVNMPAIGNFQSASNSDVFMFGLTGPATGANDFILTWTGSVNNRINVQALSVVGADQTGGTTTFKNVTKNTASGNPATVTIPSAVGDLCMACHEVATSFSTPNGTDIGQDSGGTVSGEGANWDFGASPSKTLTYSCTSGQFASIGVDIAAFGGGGGGGFTPKFRRTLSQIGGRVGTRQAFRWAGRKLISFFARPATA